MGTARAYKWLEDVFVKSAPDATLLEFAVSTREAGWKIIIDETAEKGIITYNPILKVMILHPDCATRTLEQNTKEATLMPPRFPRRQT